MISVEQLTVEFGGSPLFDEISFLVNPKESAIGPHIPMQWKPEAKPRASAEKMSAISIERRSRVDKVFYQISI